MTHVERSYCQSLPENTTDLLCFDLGDERFAIELDRVSEVLDGCELEAAGQAGSVVGVLRLRNELIPVHVANEVLRVACTSQDPLALVFDANEHRLALLVDHAEAAQAVSLDDVNPLPALTGSDRVMIGALKVNERWVALIDADAFISALLPTALEYAHDH